MTTISESLYGKIEDFISSLDFRPIEDPNQLQQSLGEIIFSKINPEASYEETKILEYEQAALYLLEQWLDNITKPFSTYGKYHWGTHVYVSLYKHSKPEDKKSRGHAEWKKISANTKLLYIHAANAAVKALTLRVITLQHHRINGDQSARSLYPVPMSKKHTNPPMQSLGEIAYNTRFLKEDFQNKSLKLQAKWESAVQYLFYVWHRRTDINAAPYINLYSWGTHLYIGIVSSRDYGYTTWGGEPVEVQEAYIIAANTVTAAVLRHTITLQKQRINGQPSDESLYPA